MIYYTRSWRAEGASMLIKKVIFGIEIIFIAVEAIMIYVVVVG